MCTAVTLYAKDHYFGRNLDYDYTFPCEVIITPQKFPFHFRYCEQLQSHYSMIGMGMCLDGYPLYYEATNEFGLSIAGLNFPENAVYHPIDNDKINIAPFEWIPYLLGQCKNLEEAKTLIQNANIVKISFRSDIPPTPLHWLIADQTGSITLEPTYYGLAVYKNPIGVLTNNPPFPYQLTRLCDFGNLSAQEFRNQFSSTIPMLPYSRGMGAIGLPGDFSSASRFVKAAFVKSNSISASTEEESVTQFFHILDSVSQINGCVKVGQCYEKTIYSSCCNMDNGNYYYTSYENRQITKISLFEHDLSSTSLIQYPIRKKQMFYQEPLKSRCKKGGSS